MHSDLEIAKGCLVSQRSSQKELYDRYINKMNAVCRRYISDKEELKDVIQEGFIKIFENIGTYRGDGPLEGWVRRVMVNTVLSHIRKNKSDLFVRQSPEEQEGYIANEEEDNGDISGSFDKEELMAAIESLPDNYKIIFNLYCIEDYSHKEIAQMLSIKEESSRTRLIRARKILREYLMALHQERLSTLTDRKEIG